MRLLYPLWIPSNQIICLKDSKLFDFIEKKEAIMICWSPKQFYSASQVHKQALEYSQLTAANILVIVS